MALGIQVFLILRELRKTVDKANKVLDDTGVITERVANPISVLSSLIMGVKTGVSFVNLLKKAHALLLQQTSFKEDEELSVEEETREANGDLKPNVPLVKERKRPLLRRFFRGISRKT